MNPSDPSGGITKPNGKQAKRWTWSKPRDKPKRPLSAYNIFFKHLRSRLVVGVTEEATDEEVLASVEAIFEEHTKTTKKMIRSTRRRQSHHRVTFENLASAVSEKWKTIDPQRKAVFQRFADLDKKRYFVEVAARKARKEADVGIISCLTDGRTSDALTHLDDPFGSNTRIDTGDSIDIIELEPRPIPDLCLEFYE